MRQLTFASLQVSDLEASTDFYTTKLGFEIMETNNPGAVVFQYQKGRASFAIRKPIGDMESKALGIGVSLWFAIDGSIENLQKDFAEKGLTLLGSINPNTFWQNADRKRPGWLCPYFFATILNKKNMWTRTFQ